jgi:hypothetical protein
MKWCREEVNTGPLAQSTYQHLAAAFDRSTNQIILTIISVLYSSHLVKPKIIALRGSPHKLVLIKENKMIHYKCHHYNYLLYINYNTVNYLISVLMEISFIVLEINYIASENVGIIHQEKAQKV